MKSAQSKSNRQFLLADLGMFTLISYLIASVFYDVPTKIFLTQLGPTLLIIALSLYLFSAFEITLEAPLSSLLSRNLLAVALATAVILVVIYLLGPGSSKNVYGRGVLSLTMATYSLYLIITRYVRFRYLRRRYPINDWIFVGSEENFDIIQKEVRDLSRHHVEHGGVNDLREVLQKERLANIVLDDQYYSAPEFGPELINEKFEQGRIKSIDTFYENYLEKVPMFHVQDYWFLSNTGFDVVNNSIRQRVKRTIDIVLVLAFLPVTLALGLISALAVFLIDRVFPFYSQRRVGLHGRVFTIYKIRTMSSSKTAEGGGWTKDNDQRVTGVGKLLRKYRLDELPQLVNVLKGDMSIIGPRPEQPSYTRMLEKEIPYYDIRHSLKPGITGWAQVKFKYGASVSDSRAKLEYDLYYIKNYSVLLDLTILIKTVYTVFSGSGK